MPVALAALNVTFAESALTTPSNDPPLTATVVEPLYARFAADAPVIVSPLAVTVLEAVATLTLLALVLERTILPE